jgi:hypothetical protein
MAYSPGAAVSGIASLDRIIHPPVRDLVHRHPDTQVRRLGFLAKRRGSNYHSE